MLPHEAPAPRILKLPRTASRYEKLTFIRLVTRLGPDSWSPAAFEGKLLPPGADILLEELGENPVLVECAGICTRGRGHRRSEFLYIVWRLDRKLWQWREAGRAVATDASWVPVIREIVHQCFQRSDLLVDVGREVDQIAERLLRALDEDLGRSVEAVRRESLARVHEGICARLAACA